MIADPKLLGIDLGGTTTKFAIMKPQGEIQQRWSIQTDVLNDGNNIIPNIIDSINHHLQLYQMSAKQFQGIGIGTPGSVDYQTGTVDSAFNLNWDRPMALKEQIELHNNIPVQVENDANVAALGERWLGAGKNVDNVAFVTLGTGVGGGIIINGQIVHGQGGSAGEIGHMTINPQGYRCTCGKRGCLETVASATGIVHVARDYAQEYAGDSELKASLDNGDDLTAKDVFDLAKQNDTLALKVTSAVCDQLGLALSIVAVTINPQYIIIGGGVSNAGDFLLQRVQESYNRYVFSSVKKTTTLTLATLENEAGVIGAASLILNK